MPFLVYRGKGAQTLEEANKSLLLGPSFVLLEFGILGLRLRVWGLGVRLGFTCFLYLKLKVVDYPTQQTETPRLCRAWKHPKP